MHLLRLIRVMVQSSVETAAAQAPPSDPAHSAAPWDAAWAHAPASNGCIEFNKSAWCICDNCTSADEVGVAFLWTLKGARSATDSGGALVKGCRVGRVVHACAAEGVDAYT